MKKDVIRCIFAVVCSCILFPNIVWAGTTWSYPLNVSFVSVLHGHSIPVEGAESHLVVQVEGQLIANPCPTDNRFHVKFSEDTKNTVMKLATTALLTGRKVEILYEDTDCGQGGVGAPRILEFRLLQ